MTTEFDSIAMQLIRGNNRIIVFTSLYPKEGKSTILANVADAIEEKGYSAIKICYGSRCLDDRGFIKVDDRNALISKILENRSLYDFILVEAPALKENTDAYDIADMTEMYEVVVDVTVRKRSDIGFIQDQMKRNKVLRNEFILNKVKKNTITIV